MPAAYQNFALNSLPQFGGPVPPALNFPSSPPAAGPMTAPPPTSTLSSSPRPTPQQQLDLGLSGIPSLGKLPSDLPSIPGGTPALPGGGAGGGAAGVGAGGQASPYPQDLRAALYGAFGGPGNIFQTVNNAPQSQQLQSYVDQASQGLKSAYQQDLANQLIELQSRYAGEGSYLSSPMFAAEGQLRANLGANYLNTLGQLQLNAGEAERGRQYGAATQQSQNSLQLAQIFSQLAQQAQASGATLQAAQYSAMANIFGSQASMFNTQTNAGVNQQGNILQYLLGQGSLGLQGQQQQWSQQFQQAQAEQLARNTALQQLLSSYYQPGQNAFNFLAPFAGLPTTSKTTGNGIGDILSGIANGVGQGVGAYLGA